jgi:hypothetical protein
MKHMAIGRMHPLVTPVRPTPNPDWIEMKTNYFEKFSGTSAGRCASSLLVTHQIKPKHIFSTVLYKSNQALPDLVVGGKYTTEMLSSPEVWARWTTAERRVAGMCLAYLVRTNSVDLVLHITRKGKGKKRYCLPTKEDSSPSESFVGGSRGKGGRHGNH